MYFKSVVLAMLAAALESSLEINRDCGIHVNAWVQLDLDNPNNPQGYKVEFMISDWYVSMQTVATYVNGEQR